MTPIEIAQRLLAGPWKHAATALRACQRSEWARFAQETAPEKPQGLFATGKRDHERCMELATQPPTGPELPQLTLIPLWTCATEDFESNEWLPAHAVVEGNQLIDVCSPTDPVLPDGAHWECTVRRWTASIVVLSRAYAPSALLQLRAGDYGVTQMDLHEVVSVEARPATPIPRPTRLLPMFASWIEPRAAVSPELAAKLQSLCFTAEDLPEEEP
jgi:hypothetical protein